jgi:hypothetical protein
LQVALCYAKKIILSNLLTPDDFMCYNKSVSRGAYRKKTTTTKALLRVTAMPHKGVVIVVVF